MHSVGIRGSIIAAVATIFVLGYGVQGSAQEAALSADAELAAKGVWNATTTYAKDDIVTARGSAWISLKAGNKNKVPGQTGALGTAAWWRLFARGFNPLGAWSNATKYQPDDLVTSSGQTYRAKITNLNKAVTNPAYWELLVTKGATGPAGPNTGIGTGSSSAPSISFTGDPDTGIYHPADGKIALVENGALFLHNLGTQNTGLGLGALASNTTGESNTAVGASALQSNIGGLSNTAVGTLALGSNTTGEENTAMGHRVLRDSISGNYNTGLGAFVLASNSTGSSNTAVGRGALAANTTGGGNIAIGTGAGASANSATQDGIFIGNTGSGAANGSIKIGTQSTHTTAFMAGIAGVNAGDVPVYVDSTTGQLGIGPAPSSRRFKYDIETMADMSSLLAKLRPVTFRYKQAKNDGSHPLQYGLIAEEVAELIPDLALFDKDGQPNGVKYHLLPSFLLAGYQAQQQTIATQASRIDTLEERLRRLEALLPQTKAAALQ